MIKSLFLSIALVAPALGGLSVDEFEKLHGELRPPTGEAWRSIPWKTSLLDAQATAAKERKPIFIWAMDGHPLGCV